MLILLFVRGIFSTDIFNYIWFGRIFGIFGGNPYIDLAASYSALDTGNWLQYGIWHDRPNIYGPVWVMLAGVIAWVAQVGDGNIVNHLLGHRLLADLTHLVNIWLVWKVAGLVITRYWRVPTLPEGTTPDQWRVSGRVAVTIAYAWNPLLLIEFGVSGHNDLLLVTCVLAATWLHVERRWRLATLALAVAGLVKFGGVIFLPGYLWLIFWQESISENSEQARMGERVWRVCQALLIAALAYVVCFAPFWKGLGTLSALPLVAPGTSSYNHSIGKILVFQLTEGINNIASWLNWQPAGAWELELSACRVRPLCAVGLTASRGGYLDSGDVACADFCANVTCMGRGGICLPYSRGVMVLALVRILAGGASGSDRAGAAMERDHYPVRQQHDALRALPCGC